MEEEGGWVSQGDEEGVGLRSEVHVLDLMRGYGIRSVDV